MVQPILLSDLVRNPWMMLANLLRRIRYRKPVHVLLRVRGDYPERTSRSRRPLALSVLLPWPAQPPTVETFAQALAQLAADPHVESVVLLVSNLSAGLATVESLRQAVARFRQSGKKAVAFLHEVSLASYYLAAACDQILAPESTSFHAIGLHSETTFLKNTLALIGIEADFEAVAEYKVTPDTYRRSEMTEPHREMIESLLDSIYDGIARSIAEGRGTPLETLKTLIDQAPMTAREAQDAGLLDELCYEDELQNRLSAQQQPAPLLSWPKVVRRLQQPVRWTSRGGIGLVSIEGTITAGPSRQIPLPLPLPIPAAQAGSDTIVQQLRAAGQDHRMSAVILYIDSPGGSAFASDLIWREVSRLRTSKPVVVFMGEQATSGGYYVAAAANAIYAQPSTLTGSIGIWAGKVVTAELYSKLDASREVISRGQAAAIYSDTARFTNSERAKIREVIGSGYVRFKSRVSEGRAMTNDEVEAIARGRVWTGIQALEHGLVDHLGDLQDAVNHARSLAGIPAGRFASLQPVGAPNRYQPPLPWPVDAATWARTLGGLVREGALALAPWRLRIRT